MAKNLIERDRTRNIKVDVPDQMLFFALFLIGATSIWVLKFLGAHQAIVTAIPIGLMLLYAYLAYHTKRYLIREDKAGDNIYYLGFLFTLTSLSYALYAYDPNVSGTSDIIGNFGIAIFTTILGLAGRVVFNQMREDPFEYEQKARYSLAEASNQLRAHLNDISIEMSNFKRKTVQIMDEGVQDIAESAKATLSENVSQFAQTSSEVIEHIRLAFAKFTDHSTRLNEIASKNVEALQMLFDRVQKIEASPDLISAKFDPVARKLEEVADEMLRRSRSQTADIKRLRDIIEIATTAGETLRKTLEAVDVSAAKRMEKFSRELDEVTAGAAQFGAAISDINKNLTNELRATSQTAAALASGLDGQRILVAECSVGLKADLEAAKQHREAVRRMVDESRAAVMELEKTLVSLSESLVEQLSGR